VFEMKMYGKNQKELRAYWRPLEENLAWARRHMAADGEGDGEDDEEEEEDAEGVPDAD
jgi:hypothetical protein